LERRRFSLSPASLDRASNQPMYLQLCATLERAIRDGLLPVGTRLPSTRGAAKMLGVSRTTVLTAYETLAAQDLIESVNGSGTRVRGTRMIPPLHVAGWKMLIRDARYPARTARFQDPDGNLLYLNQ
jgi:GntR family transcriptional regulator / MocR family aminotransferase